MKLERTPAASLAEKVGQRVRLCGWVERTDAAGGVVAVRDRSGMAALTGAPVAQREEAVEVTGTVVADGGAGVEVQLVVDDLVVLGAVLAPLPIEADSSLEERLDWRFLDLRRPVNLLVFEVQTTIERAMRQVWLAEGFLELHSPKLRPNPNRSGRELFTVGYFDRPAYLAQSPQFSKQMAMAAGFERVFEIAPVFRANPLITNRHDTEFTSVDTEISWIDSHDDVMTFEERWLRHVIEAVRVEHGEAIARQFGVDVIVPSLPFPRLALAEARGVAEAEGRLTQPVGDLDAAGERAVGQHVLAEHGHQFVFVTDYPEGTRPFYHMRCDDDSDLTRSFDLLWNGMEVTTGAQREHRYDRLIAQAKHKGVVLEPIAYFLDCFRFGCPPHGGFGLGLTRILMCLLGRDDVREVTYLHRGRHRLSP